MQRHTQKHKRWKDAATFFLLTFLQWMRTVEGCGISVHMEVGHRSKSLYPPVSGDEKGVSDSHSTAARSKSWAQRLLSKHDDAFQAGNPYPDAFFIPMCNRNGTLHDLAEQTHWTPFLNASIEYVRRTYPQRPWDEATEKLVAFLFGMSSHDVSDALWHGHLTGVQEGFLEGMAIVNFNGYTARAHDGGDTGGDIIAHYDMDMSPMKMKDHWYVPSTDLVKIYEDFYGGESPITAEDIEVCTTWQYVFRLAERLGLKKFFRWRAAKSPFQVEELQSYFLGGLHDMGLWSALVYDGMEEILDNGSDHCALYRNPVCIRCENSTVVGELPHIDCGPNLHSIEDELEHKVAHPRLPVASHSKEAGQMDAHPHSRRDYSVPQSSMPAADAVFRAVQRKRSERGLRLAPPENMGEVVKMLSKLLETGETVASEGVSGVYGDDERSTESGDFRKEESHSTEKRSADATEEELANDGTALEDGITVGGRQDHFFSSEEYSGFGSALSVGDIDGDGLDDIVVGAPYARSSGFSHGGKVYIISGSSGGEAETCSTVNVTHPQTPRVIQVLEGGSISQHGRFGSGICTGDFNGDGLVDVAVSSPTHGLWSFKYNGLVSIFLRNTSTSDAPYSPTPHITIEGVDSHTVFGHAIACDDVDGDGLSDLLVGNRYALRGRGSINLFLSSGKAMARCLDGSQHERACRISQSESDYDRNGPTIGSWFGSHVSVHRLNPNEAPVILVGAPYLQLSEDLQGVGRLYALRIEIEHTPSAPSIITNVTDEFTLTGTKLFQRVGVSADVSLFHPTTHPKRRDLGVTALSEKVSVALMRARDVTSTVKEDASLKDATPLLVVSAPTETVVDGRVGMLKQDWTHAGMVYLLNMTGLSGDITLTHESPGVLAVIKGDRHYGRLGESLLFGNALAPTNQRVATRLFVSVPHRSPDPTELIGGKAKGVILSFDIERMIQTSTQPADVSTQACTAMAVTRPCPLKAASWVVSEAEEDSRGQLGRHMQLAVDTKRDTTQIVMTSEFSSRGGRLAGAVRIEELERGRERENLNVTSRENET